MPPPTFTICIPVFNGARYIASAIDSVLGQTFGDFELIVLDNCSTDATREVVGRYADPRVRLVQNETNIGMLPNWQRGLTLGSGRYVGLLFADDAYLPPMLEQANAAFDAAPIGVFSGGARIVDETNTVLTDRGRTRTGMLTAREFFRMNYLQADCAPPSEAIVARACLERVGTFDTTLRWIVDRDLYLRAADAGFGAYHDQMPLTLRRVWAGNSTNAFFRSPAGFCDEFTLLDRFRDSHHVVPGDLEEAATLIAKRQVVTARDLWREGARAQAIALLAALVRDYAGLFGLRVPAPFWRMATAWSRKRSTRAA